MKGFGIIHFLCLLVTVVCGGLALIAYVRDFRRVGWDNDNLPLVCIYSLLAIYWFKQSKEADP